MSDRDREDALAPGVPPRPAPGGWPPPPPAPGSPPRPGVPPAPGVAPGSGAPPPWGPPGPGTPPSPWPPGPGAPSRPAGGWAPPPGPGAPPAWGPSGGWPPPGPVPHGQHLTRLRHRPGVGLVLGIAGLLLFVLSLTALDWVDEAGQSMTLGDFRDIFREMHGADGLVRDHLFDAYALFLGWVALGWAAVGLVFSAWVVPTGQAARLVVWGLTLGVVGLLVNGLDREGRVGPRLCGALMALTSLVVHAAAANDFFGEDLAPDPALGVWVGGAGLLLVAVGCIVGTRDERVPAWA